MSTTLFSARGCYYKIDLYGSGDEFWKLNPNIESRCPILIQDANIMEEEKKKKTVCFNGIRVATTFSKNFGGVSLSGIALLGEVTNTGSFGADLKAWFDANRVYTTGKPIMVSSKLTGAHSFLLESYSLNSPNIEFNTQGFTIGGAQIS